MKVVNFIVTEQPACKQDEAYPPVAVGIEVDPRFSTPYTWRETAAKMAFEQWLKDGNTDPDDGKVLTVIVLDPETQESKKFNITLRMKPEFRVEPIE
jgi:hypothetical protein